MGRPTLLAIGTLGLYTETPLHCGAESATGYVDLPVQRERHTGYPLIPGSTLKGVLRDEMKLDKRLGEAEVRRLFGSDTSDEKSPSPGIVSFGDGLLVAFPIRSSGAPFHWVTCPFVLERVFRALGLSVATLQAPAKGTAWAKAEGEVLLEEIRLSKKPKPDFFGDGPATGLTRLMGLLPGADRGFGYTREIFPERLLILHDEDFKDLVDVGTEVLTRIKLNALGTTTNIPEGEHPEIRGADRQGNLFVEEVVPPETLFLASLRAYGDRGALIENLQELAIFRVGGDETIGRGLTHLAWVPAEARKGG
jgi:CRISPR-associated protein Cmr4